MLEKTSVKKFLNKNQFNDNFFNDFKKYLTKDHKNIFKSFEKINFSLIVDKLEKIKEEKDKRKKDKTKRNRKNIVKRMKQIQKNNEILKMLLQVENNKL